MEEIEKASAESVTYLRRLQNPELMGGVQLFSGVSIDGITQLLEQCPILQLHAGERLIAAGAANDSVFLILSGRLRVHLHAEDGQPVAVLGPGESVGEISVIDHQPTSASVIADNECKVLSINEKLLWSLVRNSHDVACNLLEILAQRLRHGNSVIHRIHDLLREYEYDATIDPLTGLFNRRWLDNMLRRLMQRAQASGQDLALVMIDIDYFKQYNDGHGHLAGDRALHTVARTIIEKLRPEDTVARYGGEEMLALLPNTNLEGARVIAERLRESVAGLAIEGADGAPLPALTISAGIAEMKPGYTPSRFIAAADEALYRAKNGGRDRIAD